MKYGIDIFALNPNKVNGFQVYWGVENSAKMLLTVHNLNEACPSLAILSH